MRVDTCGELIWLTLSNVVGQHSVIGVLPLSGVKMFLVSDLGGDGVPILKPSALLFDSVLVDSVRALSPEARPFQA